ncbi:probable G-protein coupled receptor 152 [Struthio camelus]|uniref:probable G-protein coupled receptor 152 n=1 Tax=Struthio camelus TaxID=8801 RepID=UPI003603BC94
MEPDTTMPAFSLPPNKELPWDGQLLVACAALGLPANAVTIWLTGWRLQCRRLAVFTFSLAASDFLFLANSGLQIWTVVNSDMWTLGTPLCRLHIFLYNVGYYSGLFLLVAISLDRCLLVRAPLWYRCRRPASLRAVLCAGSWLVACGCSAPNMALAEVVELELGMVACHSEQGSWEAPLRGLEMLLEGLLPFSLIVTCHRAILARILWRRLAQPPTRFQQMVVATLSAYVLLNLPFQLVQLVQLAVPHLNSQLIYFMGLTFNLNSCLNPFLYLLLGSTGGTRLVRGLRTALTCLRPTALAQGPPAALANVPPADFANMPPADLTMPPADLANVPPTDLANVPPAALTCRPPAALAHGPPTALASMPPVALAHGPRTALCCPPAPGPVGGPVAPL